MPITDIAEEREAAEPSDVFTIDRFQDAIRELLGQPLPWGEASAAVTSEPGSGG